jgi:cytochrome c peroxidase
MISNSQLPLVASIHPAVAEHIDQQELNDLVASGQKAEAFEEAFEHGDELFETNFNATDGSGARVGNGQRFTRMPRADLRQTGQWATHFPARVTGPNAQKCNACHNLPEDDGAGGAEANVHRDPFHTADFRKVIERNTPHVFAPGAIQRLAEEMTVQLQGIRDNLKVQVCTSGGSLTQELIANGVSFGSIKVSRVQFKPCKVSVSTFNVRGVDPDLIVKPFQWKGSVAFLRDFNRGAAHNELGMQPQETAGDNVDGDYDGVVNELTIGDLTALSVYLAAQPRPATLGELEAHNLIEPLSAAEKSSISRGSQTFAQIGCAGCHLPMMKLNNPIFSEPSQTPGYRDASVNALAVQAFAKGDQAVTATDQLITAPDQLAAGTKDPLVAEPQGSIAGLDPSFAVSFDLTKDQFDNQIKDASGNVIYRLGSLKTDSSGAAMVELYGDLKRHYMGTGLAEGIDEVGTGAATFLTENLWGVGSTGPYLHDGRATTLTEAILEHGGEAANSKNFFTALNQAQKQDVINFLNSLVLFKMPEEE